MHQQFLAMAQGKNDYSVHAFPTTSKEFGTMITLGAEEGAIYITKAQAMEFFGLVEPTEHKTWCDEAMAASNKAGFVGISAAQTIELQKAVIAQLMAELKAVKARAFIPKEASRVPIPRN